MAPVPSIKASAFQTLSNELERWLAEGRLTQGELEERVRPGDLPYLQKQLAASSWVPVDTCARVLDVLVEFRANGSRADFLRAEGVRSASELHQRDLYKQFDASLAEWGEQAGNVLVSLGAVVYNFASWSYQRAAAGIPDRVIVTGATELPEIIRFTTEGFIEYMWKSVLGAVDVFVTSARPAPDEIVFSVHHESTAHGSHSS
jgi:hypothetical protein